ncbi:hypothetical protein PF010_g11798 [Phytophthora fragariae]|uniref:Uncharacterized protein n=1 Tax=Phytophthora fragariae TaxID=53985 RepID=A0A6G0L4J4_9STRA|nr:hypothetical protein PF010_g11798 [Phytophthora fragariae]
MTRVSKSPTSGELTRSQQRAAKELLLPPTHAALHRRQRAPGLLFTVFLSATASLLSITARERQPASRTPSLLDCHCRFLEETTRRTTRRTTRHSYRYSHVRYRLGSPSRATLRRRRKLERAPARPRLQRADGLDQGRSELQGHQRHGQEAEGWGVARLSRGSRVLRQGEAVSEPDHACCC